MNNIQLKQTKTNKRALFSKPQTGSPLALCFQTSSAFPSKVYLSSSPESVPMGLWHKNSQHLTQSELVPLWRRWGGRLVGLSTACLLTEHKRLQTEGFSLETLLLLPSFLFSFYQRVGAGQMQTLVPSERSPLPSWPYVSASFQGSYLSITTQQSVAREYRSFTPFLPLVVTVVSEHSL